MPTIPQYSDVQFGFDVRTPAAVDRRFLLTAQEMESGLVDWEDTRIPLTDIMPAIYFVQCADDNKLYIYDKTYPGDEYSHGKFRLLTKVLDVKNENDISLVDSEGVVHLYDEAKEKILDIYNKLSIINDELDEIEDRLLTKATKAELDSEGTRAKAAEINLQNQIDHYVDGPYLKKDLVSKYDVGGVAKYQAFAKGTSIIDIVRQILEGDPREDGVIFYAVVNELPTYMTDIAWNNIMATRTGLVNNGLELDDQVLNNQILLIALPKAMVKQTAEEEGVVVRPVELKYMYAPQNPEFKFDWSYVDIKREAVSESWNYRCYFPCHQEGGVPVPSRSTGVISRVYAFYHHNPEDPDPSLISR